MTLLFESPGAGTIAVLNGAGETLMSHAVERIFWRLCRVKDEPVRDWVKLAVTRARLTGAPLVFWLDAKRAHDAQLIKKVEAYLPEHDLSAVEYRILATEATKFSLQRMRNGQDTISVTGNVLRDYLTVCFQLWSLAPVPRCCQWFH